MIRCLLLLAALLAPALAGAQVFRPPPFIGGIPGQAQMQAITMQRHQARTLLYREALEELRRNPQVVDVRECTDADADRALCLPRPAGAGVPEAAAAQPTARRIALLIGNNRYQSPIPPLETPLHDVDRIAAVLRDRFGFEARIVNNASKAELIVAVAALARESKVVDSVVVYYAGHGYQLDDTGMGYWIPVDGSVKSAAQWISNVDIARLLAAIPARQLLLVSDSCFSGLLAREKSLTAGTSPAADVLRRRSVVVLSSGGEEPVSDEGKGGHSIFAWHFLRTLDEISGVRPGFDVYQRVRSAVSRDFPQNPSYGAVLSAGHEAGGEYLFDAAARWLR